MARGDIDLTEIAVASMTRNDIDRTVTIDPDRLQPQSLHVLHALEMYPLSKGRG